MNISRIMNFFRIHQPRTGSHFPRMCDSTQTIALSSIPKIKISNPCPKQLKRRLVKPVELSEEEMQYLKIGTLLFIALLSIAALTYTGVLPSDPGLILTALLLLANLYIMPHNLRTLHRWL